jgi:5-methylcytosine-specific restriction endonuclease McrA
VIDDPGYDAIWQSMGGKCVVCGKPAVTIHEIVPKGRCVGDWRVPENRITVCCGCHEMIHLEGSREWEDQLRRLRLKAVAKYAK